MIPDAVFRPETRRKRPVSGRNLRENGRNLLQKFHDRIRLPELIGTGRKWQEFYRKRSPYPYGKTASVTQRESHGNSTDQAGSGRTATTWVTTIIVAINWPQFNLC